MAPSDNRLEDFRLNAIRYGAKGISLFELTPLSTEKLPAVSAGSHIDLALGNGILRQYSLVTPLCDSRRYTIAVKRETTGRGGSKRLHDEIRVGDLIGVSEPRNLFPLSDDTTPVLLIAGGIGITPVYAMYHELIHAGRTVTLHYWCQNQAQCLFYDELAQQANVYIHLSTDNPDTRASVSNVVEQAGTDMEIYGCGPARLLDELEACKDTLGQPRIFTERFQAATAATTDNQGFTLVLARSDEEVTVAPGQTILDALINADVDVMYSCEQGICGACEQKVIEGQPIHHDSVASAEQHEQNKTIMICCSSSASSRLVLDL